MKVTTLISLFLLLTALVSCGGKKGGGGGAASGVFTSALSTRDGYVDDRGSSVEVDGRIYHVSQQTMGIVSQALYQARMNRIQPQLVNGSYKYRAHITASISQPTGYPSQPGYPQPGYPQPGYPTYPPTYQPTYPGYPNTTSGYTGGYVQEALNVSNIVFF